VDCLKLHKLNNKRGYIHVRTLQAGCHFGELALLNNDRRSLSVRCQSQGCQLLMLDRDAFTRILGSIESNLKMDYHKEFDMKMEAVRSHKRTFSQIFDHNVFQEIQPVKSFCNGSLNLQSCNTIIQNENLC